VSDLAAIPHYDGVRCNTIEGYTREGTSAIEATAAVKQALAESGFVLPPGYRVDYGGARMERDRAVAQLMGNFWWLSLLIFATVVLTFRSFRLAGIVFVVAVLSTGFGFLSLWVFGLPFGMIAIVGILGMVGLAINDTIMVLTELRHDPGAAAGDPAAVRDVVVRSTRHVLSTSITTIVGFVPLVVAGGEFWPPLSIVIAAGVGGATLLALYLAPAAFLLLNPRRARAQ
jgi:multidrug efflux pump subunit AcrB